MRWWRATGRLLNRVEAKPCVRAGGGLVVDGDGRVLLVHRPKYDDWTLPKGKADPGEDDLACALREVEEETGLDCRAGRELASTAYVDGKGRDKLVRYWAMTAVAGDAHPNPPEVDELRWLPVPDARRLLSYDRDHPVLDSFTNS